MVETLPLDPADRVLEVGCGHGIAVGLIGERLVTGTITGIDRSAKMIAAATKRNAALIDADRVRLRTASLHELDDAPGLFDLICAVNVASFWTQPARDLGASRCLLASGGALCLFAQLPPWALGGATWLDDVSTTLRRHGFLVTAHHRGDVDPYPTACVIARTAHTRIQPRAASSASSDGTIKGQLLRREPRSLIETDGPVIGCVRRH
jgi:SAM-dependent methyltransferase